MTKPTAYFYIVSASQSEGLQQDFNNMHPADGSVNAVPLIPIGVSSYPQSVHILAS